MLRKKLGLPLVVLFIISFVIIGLAYVSSKNMNKEDIMSTAVVKSSCQVKNVSK